MSRTTLGFVATKPLQIMACLGVAQQARAEDAILAVVPAFADGERIVNALAEEPGPFARVVTARTRSEALRIVAMAEPERIFVDSDVGLKTPTTMRWLRMRRPSLRFALYEEGISLIDPPKDRVPRSYVLLGGTLALGESPLIDEIWTHDPDAVAARLPKKRIVRFRRRLTEFVRDHHDLLQRVFWPDMREHVRAWHGDRCCVYMSSWEVDEGVLDHVASRTGFTICKLHPHIRRTLSVPKGIDQVVPPSVPGELLVPALATKFEHVEVLHHGTSTAHYLSLPNVTFTLSDGVPGVAAARRDPGGGART